MRKLNLQMQITLDGFNSTGPSDEKQWVTWDLDGIQSASLNSGGNIMQIRPPQAEK